MANNADLVKALRNLVNSCESQELADGSNIDTCEAHAILGDFDAAAEEVDHGTDHDVPEDDDKPHYISDGSSYRGGYRTFRDGSYREDFRSDC